MIVATARDAAALFAPVFADAPADAPTLAVAHLDEGRRLIELTVWPVEAMPHVELPVRRILEDGLRLGARSMVIAHNRPGGDAEPSREDVETTRELLETGARLGIRLLDRLIFAAGEQCSMRALGLI